MVTELHSDFLSYLTFSNKHTPHDEESRSSVRQLRAGGVRTLVTTVYSSTSAKNPSDESRLQMLKYHELVMDKNLPFVSPLEPFVKDDSVMIIPSIENASGFAAEDEPLDVAFSRFEKYFTAIPPIYMSLTWHEENRFGGGNMTDVGLKPDGKVLLEFLEGKVCSIDLSHTSDALARDIIAYIEQKNLKHTLIASHSNFRDVMNVPRNLPLDIASYIVQNGGVIGLNLVDAFVGTKVEDLLKHIEYAVQYDFMSHLAFGADFFYPKTTGNTSTSRPSYHFSGWDTVACYQLLIRMIEDRFSEAIARSIASENANKLLFTDYRTMVENRMSS